MINKKENFNNLINAVNSHLTVMKLAPSPRYQNSLCCIFHNEKPLLKKVDSLIEINADVINKKYTYHMMFIYSIDWAYNIYLCVEDGLEMKKPKIYLETRFKDFYYHHKNINLKFAEAAKNIWKNEKYEYNTIRLNVLSRNYKEIEESFKKICGVFESWNV